MFPWFSTKNLPVVGLAIIVCLSVVALGGVALGPTSAIGQDVTDGGQTDISVNPHANPHGIHDNSHTNPHASLYDNSHTNPHASLHTSLQANSHTNLHANIHTQSGADVKIGSELESTLEESTADDTVEVLVWLDSSESATFQTAVETGAVQAASVADARTVADVVQAPLLAYAESLDAVDVTREFWIANAVLLEAPAGKISALLTVDGVDSMTANYEVQLVGYDSGPSISSFGEADYTDGLEQVNAPTVWDAFDTRGAGVTVAVVDTGVDPDHADFEGYDESNWAEFDVDGTEITSTPYDENGHGTHVSGTVLGGNASGTHIGVAPEAELYAINVFPDPDGSTTITAVLAGIEHAVEVEADVISLSLGNAGYTEDYIEPILNAQAEGIHVVAASGNAGPDSAGSPANVFNATAVGATDDARQVAGFSSGELVDTEEAWGSDALDSWPDEYATPDVSAPGVGVISAYIEDGGTDVGGEYYASISGTSMATPHVTGVVALLLSERDLDPAAVKETLESTANKPPSSSIGSAVHDDAMEVYDDEETTALRLSQEGERDVRYGTGIVDAYAVLASNDPDAGAITAAVHDADDNTAVAATVELGTVDRTTDNWEFEASGGSLAVKTGVITFDVMAGSYELFASADVDGYYSNSTTIAVGSGDTIDDFAIALERTFAVELLDGQPPEVASGESFDVTFHVADLEELTVEFGEETDLSAEDVTLTVAGEDAGELAIFGVGETVDIAAEHGSSLNDTLLLTVEVSAGLEGTLDFDHAFTGSGHSETIATGQTAVLEDPEHHPPEITEATIASERYVGAPSEAGRITVTNPSDFTNDVALRHVISDDQESTTVTYGTTLGPGESAVFLLGPYRWDALGGPGEDVDHQVLVYDDPGDDTAADETSLESLLLSESGTITGEVVDPDGLPVSGIDVTATDGSETSSTTTGSDGRYHLDPVAPGEYTVTVDGPSFTDDSAVVTLDDRLNPVEQDFVVGTRPVFEFDLKAGESYALGFPAPIAGGTIGDVVDMQFGQIWRFDAEETRWESIGPDAEVGVLDAYVIVPGEDASATIEFAGDPTTEPGLEIPGTADLVEGWNFLAPSLFGPPADAFPTTADELVVGHTHDAPPSPMVPPGELTGFQLVGSAEDVVSPFGGYFLFVDDAGESSSLTIEHMSLLEAYDTLAVDTTSPSGELTSGETGDPIPGAHVRIDGTSHGSASTPSGGFSIPATPAEQSVTLGVDAPGFQSTQAEIEPGEPLDLSLDHEEFFAVTSLSVNETTLETGDWFEVEFTVENRGVEPGSQAVSVGFTPDAKLTGEATDVYRVTTTQVDLDPGEQTTVTLVAQVDDFVETGEQELVVDTADDWGVETVTVSDSE